MISGNCEDRREVVLVRLIKLSEVLRRLTVEVDAIAEQVEESRIGFGMCGVLAKVALHAVRDELLRHGIFDAADVAIDVEDEGLGLLDRGDLRRRQHRGEVEPKWFLPGRLRQRLKLARREAPIVDGERQRLRRHPRTAESMKTADFRHEAPLAWIDERKDGFPRRHRAVLRECRFQQCSV